MIAIVVLKPSYDPILSTTEFCFLGILTPIWSDVIHKYFKVRCTVPGAHEGKECLTQHALRIPTFSREFLSEIIFSG